METQQSQSQPLPMFFPNPLPFPQELAPLISNIPLNNQFTNLLPQNLNFENPEKITPETQLNTLKKIQGFQKWQKKPDGGPPKSPPDCGVTQKGFSPFNSIDISSHKSEDDQITQQAKPSQDFQPNCDTNLQNNLNTMVNMNENLLLLQQQQQNNLLQLPTPQNLELNFQNCPDMNMLPFNFIDQNEKQPSQQQQFENMKKLEQQLSDIQSLIFQQQQFQQQQQNFLETNLPLPDIVPQQPSQLILDQKALENQIKNEEISDSLYNNNQLLQQQLNINLNVQNPDFNNNTDKNADGKKKQSNGNSTEIFQLKRNKGDKQPLNTSHVPINMMNNLVTYLLRIYDKKIQCKCPSYIPRTTIKKLKIEEKIKQISQESTANNTNTNNENPENNNEKSNEKCMRCQELEKIISMKKSKIKNIKSFQVLWENKRVRALSENYFLYSGSQQILYKNYRSQNNRQALFECLPSFLDGVRNYQKFWKLI